MSRFCTHYTSPVGVLEIIANETAIESLLFVDTVSTTATDQHPLLNTCTTQLEEYFAGTRQVFELPIQQKGTDFQQRVWQELIHIPFGKTISYLQLAKQLGDEKVIRAAGTSNGKNAIAIIVPCHRVIGSNGSLVGYAGGLARKQWLLEHESKIAHGTQTLF